MQHSELELKKMGKNDRDESQQSEKIGLLKMESTDGKSYKTDVADTEELFYYDIDEMAIY